ncbi:hypothetical protein GCM10009578_038360 [Streptomyces rhizosphaericus]
MEPDTAGPAGGTVCPSGSCRPARSTPRSSASTTRAITATPTPKDCTATITTVPEHPADSPQHYRFRFWQHDPAADEPPIEDIETYPLPG